MELNNNNSVGDNATEDLEILNTSVLCKNIYKTPTVTKNDLLRSMIPKYEKFAWPK